LRALGQPAAAGTGSMAADAISAINAGDADRITVPSPDSSRWQPPISGNATGSAAVAPALVS